MCIKDTETFKEKGNMNLIIRVESSEETASLLGVLIDLWLTGDPVSFMGIPYKITSMTELNFGDSFEFEIVNAD